MLAQKNFWKTLAILFCLFFLHSPIYAAEAPKKAKTPKAANAPKQAKAPNAAYAPKQAKAPNAAYAPKQAKAANTPKEEKYKLAIDICSKQRTSDARRFCLEILKSDPHSASATEYSTLLKIATNAALENAKRIIDSFERRLKIKNIKPPLKSVFEDCIEWYAVAVNGYLGINKDIKSRFVDSDARLANAEIRGCQGVLDSKKISEPFISNRNRIAEGYGVLVVEIAEYVIGISRHRG
ncbi:hypothetical protein ACH5RR_026656 [Cinchona calisaya]|uniref:Pectinesterase inhibitor domain-containing protein n=1 Tax=Cinchona calisaya TaxID=153742 RepID=A0ABD2Z577_9GENT